MEASEHDPLAKKLAQTTYVELRRIRTSSKVFGATFEHALSVLRSFQLKIDPAGSCSIGIDINPAKGFADSGDLSLDIADVFRAIGEATQKAFSEPTERHDIQWESQTLSKAVDAASGYPYFIQQCGFCICEQIEAPGTITSAELVAGIALARDEVDRGLYRSRWDRATPKGKEMMRAMAEDDEPSRLSDVAQRMGKKKQGDLSVLRDRLIQDGLIYSPERGYVAFTVLGMSDYIRRCAE